VAVPASEKKNVRVLIVEDEGDVRSFFANYLDREGLDVTAAGTAREALQHLADTPYDVMLLDLRLPDMHGIELLREAKKIRPEAAVIVITAVAEVDVSVEAMRLGAWNYHVKPIGDPSRILGEILQAAPGVTRNGARRGYGAQVTVRRSPFLVGDTPAMKQVLDLAARAAAVDSCVLICGESGTGKELVARLIHENCARKSGKFLAVNCSAVADTLLESTLFGYERGAFTGAYKRTKGYFEAADGGTLFLDEIADTSLRFQARLLRAIEEHSFQRVGGTETIFTDVRIISATNKNLDEQVRAGRFREDLYYRINVLNIFIPPLRERVDDIRPLVEYFLRKHSARTGVLVKGFTEECLRRLESYHWPGNVRELENVVERALAFKDGGEVLGLDSLPPALRDASPPPGPTADGLRYPDAKRHFETQYLRRLLDAAGGNVSAAARMAGIARQNLYAKMRKYGISHKEA